MPERGKAKIFRQERNAGRQENDAGGQGQNAGAAAESSGGSGVTGTGDGAAAAAPDWAGLSPQTVGILLALAAAFFWSTSGMFIKLLSIDPIPLASVRCAMAGMLMAPLLRSARIRMERDLALLIIFYAAVSLTFVTATRWTTAANAIAMQSTGPAWVFLVTCILARRIFWRYTVPIAIILSGLGVMLLEPVEGERFTGNLMGLASGLCFAGFIIFYSRVQRPVIQVMVVMNLGAAFLIFLAEPGAFRIWEFSWCDWLILIYLGGVQVGLAHSCFYLALKRISTSQGAILAVLEPLLNPIWVYAAIGEIPSEYGFTGGGLVLSGIVVDAWLRRNGQTGKGPAP